ncbi:MAG: Imm49 family immunity protein, partial [Cyclobacteriaceae bacterium]
SYALLSDNEALIKRYANLRHSNYEAMIKGGGTAPMYILQCIIKDDWKEYERVMPIMKTKTVKKFKMEMDAAYYEALAERSKSKLEEILSEFVTPKIHKQRNKAHELINEFISHPAIGYAKLAWLKGIEVKIDSPLVPSDLLPVKPNETYQDDYDFLKA